MNAAFLLVTTAWLSGVEADPPKAAAPVVSTAPAAGSCCGASACSTCNDGCRESLLSKIRARLSRDNGCDSCPKEGLLSRLKDRFHRDSCCQPACAPAPTCCAPAPKPVCAPAPTCCAPKPVCAPAPTCCAPAAKSCGGCGSKCDACCDGPSLLDRLKARFQRNDCCPTSSCGATSCCGTAAPAMKVEPINPPKSDKQPDKLPKGPEETGKSVQIIPAAPPVLEVTPAKTESPF